jgi:hypothetical protein
MLLKLSSIFDYVTRQNSFYNTSPHYTGIDKQAGQKHGALT